MDFVSNVHFQRIFIFLQICINGAARWSALRTPRFSSRLGSLSVWSLHILPVSVWVSSGCSSFLPQPKDVQVKCIGHAKFSFSLPKQALECGD